MKNIATAYDALEARKSTLMGAEPASVLESPDAFQRRALVSGFDVDHDDLVDTAERLGKWACQFLVPTDLPLHKVFATIWVDAFATGLMFTTLKDGDGPDIELSD